MPIYVYRCDCGTRFERLSTLDAATPDCPSCGGATRKVPAGPNLARGGAGSTGGDRVPPQWRGVRDGGPERVQREVQMRQGLAEKAANQPGAETPPG